MADPILSATEFQALLKKDPCGIFLFFGEEEYLKQHALKSARQNVLSDPSLSDFNYQRLEQEYATPDALLQALETPPLFADRRLIELHSIPWESLNEEVLSAWQDVFSKGNGSDSALVIVYAESNELDSGTERLPGKRLSALAAHCRAVRFPKQTDLQLAKWIFRHFTAQGLQISSEVCHQMLDFCGHDMCFLSTEIEKVAAYLKFNGRSEVKTEDISYLCAYNPERDTFDFTNAILDGNTAKAFELFAEMKGRKERPEVILGSIAKICCDLAKIRFLCDSGASPKELESKLKMHAYRLSLYQKQALRRPAPMLEQAVRLCAETDVKMKSTACDPYLLLERLIVEISLRGTK